MCFFKRLIYAACPHVLFLGPDPVRKCHLQLAYEQGQTAEPCGKMWTHSYASLRVDGAACHRCDQTRGTLRKTRALLREMRTRLEPPGSPEEERRRGGGGGEKEDGFGDEGLSPVKLRFSSSSHSSGVGGGVSSRGGGDEDGSVSSFSLEGAALSAVGVDD